MGFWRSSRNYRTPCARARSSDVRHCRGSVDSGEIPAVGDWTTNSTAIEAIQTLLRVLYYRPACSKEAIYGLCKLLAGLPLAAINNNNNNSFWTMNESRVPSIISTLSQGNWHHRYNTFQAHQVTSNLQSRPLELAARVAPTASIASSPVNSA